ncbi:ABATE domain-containing protein [Nonomuraea sp. NEAU-A123]|uniref:CGNR zinc finger domain-containing protein n=1 Tax=Nonomuraea sp. NEAU-A123 TaxID=2839649 RepID=UPI001BE426B2|nr:ABATE domain-containing protein [Nonomuraea sp. NEAU-A123]MBT2233065.1 ABATE domain-containing protein [Nonomuraea sp. NEAU-A123]
MSRSADPRMAFPFISGRVCLDFTATLGKRHAAAFERLPDPAALGRWIAEAGLHPEPGEVTPSDLAQARLLREALYRVVRAVMDGSMPDPSDIAEVNAASGRPDLAPLLALTDSGPALRRQAAHVAPAALATVARDAVMLVTGPLIERVKECANPGCSLLFLDDSQARRRRWCSMERCGNLAKIAGYRSRSRATH